MNLFKVFKTVTEEKIEEMAGIQDVNEILISQAVSVTTPIAYWKFVPGGELIIDDRDFEIYAGDIYYLNAVCDISNSIKVKDWAFCVERMKHEAPGVFYIGGFHGDTHYTFGQIKPGEVPHRAIIIFIITRIVPLFYPEILDGIRDRIKDEPESEIKTEGKGLKLEWKLKQFEGEELKSTQDPQNYKGRGTIEGGLTREQIKELLSKDKS